MARPTRAPRKHYSIDVFEGVEELQDLASEKDSSAKDRTDDSGDDFALGADVEDEDDTDGDDELQVEEDRPDGDSDADDEPMPDEDGSTLGNLEGVQPKKARRKRRATSGLQQTYLRGLADGMINNLSRDQRRIQYFGASLDDSRFSQEAQVKYSSEPTLPSRRQHNGTNAAYDKQARQGWAWYYYEGGKEAFGERQLLRRVDPDVAAEYMVPLEDHKSNFLMGPYNDQKFFTLAVGESVPLIDAWPARSVTGARCAPKPSAHYKPGFILNLGGKIQCIGWAPNRSGGIHHLAVSVIPSHRPVDTSVAPAFTLQPPSKSAIQIWQIHASADFRIDGAKPPIRSLTFCIDWGDVKSLTWCPIPCDFGDASLLAFISSDGALRIIDVPLDASQDSADYLCENTAFESAPPNTLCTCVTWLSSARIAAGCANGCIAIWDLPGSLASASSNARPMIYSAISTSYIFSIACCGPSHPSFIATTSATGFASLTDLRNPSLASPSATVLSQRSRLAHRLLQWHEFTQAALTVDDNFALRAFPFRRWFCTLSAGRARSLGTCMAVSPCHPFVLVGGANGEVVGINPLNRLVGRRAAVLQQVWFLHQWRRPLKAHQLGMAATRGLQERSEVTKDGVLKRGLSRIVEGFKFERVALRHDDRASENGQDGLTIYEEPTAVTALAWNPNLEVAGWAAAGMADGLLRVEDIAV